ncbi:MAG: hypothetical protein ACR2FM_00280 [Candidatus Saccharimonadales bacterium]
MKTTLTITSKRQVTIPKKLWDQLQLDGVRYLQANVKNGKLELQKVAFGSQLETFWRKTDKQVTGAITDASIKQAARRARQQKDI